MSYSRLFDGENDIETGTGAYLWCRAQSRATAALDVLQYWWKQTTDPRYLKSSTSRRDFIWLQLVAVTLLNLLYDASLAWSGFTCSLDSCLLLCCALLRCMPSSSLRLELVVWCLFVAYPTAALQCPNYTFGFLPSCTLFVLAMHFASLHAIVIIAYGVVQALVALCFFKDSAAFVTLLVAGTCSFGVRALTDYSLCSMFIDSLSNQMAVEQLLEYATDGTCDIDVGTGCFTSVSSKLLGILDGTGSMKGHRFTDLLLADEDRNSFHRMLDHAGKECSLKPILVTGTTCQHKEFDVKCVPYSVSPHCLRLCFQIVGEMRKQHGVGQRPQEVRPTLQTDCDFYQLEGSSSPNYPTCNPVPVRCLDATNDRAISEARRSIFSSLGYSESISAGPSCRATCCQGVQTDAATLDPKSSHAIADAWTQTTFSIGNSRSRCNLPRLPPQASIRLNSRQRLLRDFQATPSRMQRQLLEEMLNKINPRGSGCCLLHIRLFAVMGHAREMAMSECRPEEAVHELFQCSDCKTLHSNADGRGFCLDCCTESSDRAEYDQHRLELQQRGSASNSSQHIEEAFVVISSGGFASSEDGMGSQSTHASESL